jgi:hypothetical protein
MEISWFQLELLLTWIQGKLSRHYGKESSKTLIRSNVTRTEL